MILQTTNTTVRQVIPEDAPFILRLLNEPCWIRFIGDKNIHDADAARAYINDRILASYSRHGFGMYLAREKSTGSPIGLIGFVKRDTLDAPDIGYAVCEAHQRKGYAVEVGRALIEHGWETLGFETLYGFCLPDNIASIRVLERLGLTYLRDQDVNQSNELCRLYQATRPQPPGTERANR